MNRGPLGTESLNRELRDLLNPEGADGRPAAARPCASATR